MLPQGISHSAGVLKAQTLGGNVYGQEFIRENLSAVPCAPPPQNHKQGTALPGTTRSLSRILKGHCRRVCRRRHSGVSTEYCRSDRRAAAQEKSAASIQ